MIFGRSKAEVAAEEKWRADMLAEMRRMNASLAALPPVLNAIASGVMAGIGPSFAGPQGEPLTLADLNDCPDCGEVAHAETCPRRNA